MRHSLASRLSPAMVVALLALFFAVGGSAFAVGQKTAALKPVYQCKLGAVRGFASFATQVVGDVFPGTYSSEARLFEARFNCSGGAVQVKKVGRGVFDVKFVGNGAKVAVGSVSGGEAGSFAWGRAPDGAIRVTVTDARGQATDLGFVVALL